jgi:FMN reductase
MGYPRIVALSGNTRRPSKTRSLIEAVIAAHGRHAEADVKIYDFLDTGLEFGAATSRRELSAATNRIFEAVEGADALIVGSPVYKGAYSGHFKHFFDLIEPTALLNKPICLTASGGGHRHALMTEHFLRPLFGFFGALTLPTSVYAGERDFSDGIANDPIVLERIASAASEIAAYALRSPTKSEFA